MAACDQVQTQSLFDGMFEMVWTLSRPCMLGVAATQLMAACHWVGIHMLGVCLLLQMASIHLLHSMHDSSDNDACKYLHTRHGADRVDGFA